MLGLIYAHNQSYARAPTPIKPSYQFVFAQIIWRKYRTRPSWSTVAFNVICYK